MNQFEFPTFLDLGRQIHDQTEASLIGKKNLNELGAYRLAFNVAKQIHTELYTVYADRYWLAGEMEKLLDRAKDVLINIDNLTDVCERPSTALLDELTKARGIRFSIQEFLKK